MKYHFSGWATKNNLECSDGRTIRKDAFKDNDGETVPLVWNHQHNDIFNVLGHALLENREDGVYAYCTINEDTAQGQDAIALIKHGDIQALSIYANQLKQRGGDVLHGKIRELSLVLGGANPGAYIDTVSFAHGDDTDEGEAIIYTGEFLELSHSDDDKGDDEQKKEPEAEDKKDLTYGDVMDSMSEEEMEIVHNFVGAALRGEDVSEKDIKGYEAFNDNQKELVHALVGAALEDSENDNDEEEEETEMKHNVFENDNNNGPNVLSHSDMEAIFADAKRCGSLREAVDNALDGGVLAHSLDTTGMTTATGTQTYGFNDPSMLFPEYKSLNTPPEWISRNMDWVSKVMGGVHHTPFSRIKSMYADITEDAARAKGYIKGKMKKEEVFSTLKRTTDPQTIYKKQKLDRDDIVDITDFDVVAWIRAEMRVMLNEEIARAILIGDGRLSSDDDKIQELHVRPIVTDVPLFNTTVKISAAANYTDEAIAKATINGAIRARKNYKGSGNPTFFTTEDTLTEMLLLEDGIGHKLYKTEAELATALRVKEIVTVEPMEGQKLTIDSKELPLIGVIVNMADYNVGADKGGEINMFDDFDIDYNQFKYLIETRISGALVKPYSALTLVLDKATSSTTP